MNDGSILGGCLPRLRPAWIWHCRGRCPRMFACFLRIKKVRLTGTQWKATKQYEHVVPGILALYIPGSTLDEYRGVRVAQWLAHSLFTNATRVRSSDWAGKYVKWYGYQPGYAPVLRTETVKTEVPCHSECRHVKEPSLLNGHKCRA